MEKQILITVLAILILMASFPYIVGKINHQSAIVTVQNFTDGSDGDIEDVLRCYNFNLGWADVPSFTDYYVSGYQTIINYQEFTN